MVTELPQADPPPPPDSLLVEIATYALTYDAASESAREHEFHHLLDAVARALQALRVPACTRLLGPIVPGATMARGARVPGTSYELDPVKAAFDIGTLMRWPDGQDAPPAVMPAHPADNLGALLGLTDYLSRRALAQAESPPTVRELLCAVIKANEIQGALALAAGDALDGAQLDRSVLVRIASAAVATTLIGG
ncbi:MAG: MmgE/PrpD family protein, partial [Steroidobacteraceae bacterium]